MFHESRRSKDVRARLSFEKETSSPGRIHTDWPAVLDLEAGSRVSSSVLESALRNLLSNGYLFATPIQSTSPFSPAGCFSVVP